MTQIGLDRYSLAGRVAVVTGGGRGIGREIALAFGRSGAKVVIAELSEQGRETERLVKELGGQALFVQTDVSSESDVGWLARAAYDAFGPVNILINNAILCPAARVMDMDVALWNRVMEVNLRGAFLTCKAFLPDMLNHTWEDHQRPVIINMVSTDAMPGLSAYIASKQGLTGFSQSLAAEVGQAGVRVIAFAPGMVDTPGIREVARGLAPNLGLSPEQFLQVSLHPAYAGLMPAGHAAAATAYLVAHLAEEYHGEVIDGYTVLERSGLIQAPQVVLPPAGPEATVNAGAVPMSGEATRRAMALSRQLQVVIDETETEFNKLPIFVRPMARAGFKSKAGQSLQDWKRTAARLTGQLEAIAADASQVASLRASVPALNTSLEKLEVYYYGVPAETARFTKDTNLLREVSQVCSERVALIKSLAAALELI